MSNELESAHGDVKMWNGAHYDKVADPQAKWGESVIERLDIPPNSLVLDAGCGSGRVTEALLRKHPTLCVVALRL